MLKEIKSVVFLNCLSSCFMISKVMHPCYLKSRKNFNPMPRDVWGHILFSISSYKCTYFPPKMVSYVAVFNLCSVIFQGYVSVSVYNSTFGMLTAGYSFFGWALIYK